MKSLTVKNSFVLNPHSKEKTIIPVGSNLIFIEQNYYFYHAYYESHDYKIVVQYKDKKLEISIHRVHNSKVFSIKNCQFTHNEKRKILWDDLFEESCTLSIN